MSKDYYSILGVTKESTPSEIKAAYRKLALKFHPDKNPGDPFFEKMFIEVKEAYDVLTALHSKKEENSKSARSTTESSTKKAENQSNNTQFDQSQLIDSILVNLKNIQLQSKNKTKKTVKSRNYLNYINKILSDEMVRLMQNAEPQKREEFIFAILPLLSFFQKKEGESLLMKIISISGPDNSLIREIDRKFKENNRKQIVIEGVNGIVENRAIIFAILFFGVVIFLGLSFSSGTRNYNTGYGIGGRRPELIEIPSIRSLSEIPSIRTFSKWAGNKLNTGDSPYNNYFGTGVYDSQFLNEITIHNGQSTDAIVCLTEYESPNRTIRNEYIRAGESFKLTSVPNGLYSLKWFYGNNWNPDTLYMEGIQGFFDSDAGFSKSDSYGDLIKMQQGADQYSVVEITLYAVQNGNMETKEINSNEFFKKN
jgi:curved DNA-binding protein CbpA